MSLAEQQRLNNKIPNADLAEYVNCLGYGLYQLGTGYCTPLTFAGALPLCCLASYLS